MAVTDAPPVSSGRSALIDELSEVLGVDLTEVTAETRLVEDLGWDSLTFVEVLAIFESAGACLPEELVSELRTIGDLDHYHRTLAGTRPAPQPGERAAANVRLEPVSAAHHDWLYRLHSRGDHLVRYRFRGVTPSPDAFIRNLWDRVLAQFVVVTRDGVPVGQVAGFDPDLRNRHAHLAAVAAPDWQGTGLVLEGAAILVSYLFAQFDLRKLYLETLDSNLAGFASGVGRVITPEGRLGGHEYINGRYEDLVVGAIWRDDWRHHHQRIFGSEPDF